MEDAWGYMPLHWAAYFGHREAVLHLLELAGGPALQRIMLSHASYARKFTPLHRAVARGHTDVCQELLNAQASVECQDWKKRTPIEFAQECEQNKTAFVLQVHARKLAAKMDNPGQQKCGNYDFSRRRQTHIDSAISYRPERSYPDSD
eukprot:GEMP01053651.1.p1 GENE.GEMP01053651.1~~GEMP01053651.1.p1  ORF type:complete len:148 (+),score=29.95 GEMP01053651.1:372-815(+)